MDKSSAKPLAQILAQSLVNPLVLVQQAVQTLAQWVAQKLVQLEVDSLVSQTLAQKLVHPKVDSLVSQTLAQKLIHQEADSLVSIPDSNVRLVSTRDIKHQIRAIPGQILVDLVPSITPKHVPVSASMSRADQMYLTNHLMRKKIVPNP